MPGPRLLPTAEYFDRAAQRGAVLSTRTVDNTALPHARGGEALPSAVHGDGNGRSEAAKYEPATLGALGWLDHPEGNTAGSYVS